MQLWPILACPFDHPKCQDKKKEKMKRNCGTPSHKYGVYDAPHEGLLKIERRGFRVLGFRSLRFGSLGFQGAFLKKKKIFDQSGFGTCLGADIKNWILSPNIFVQGSKKKKDLKPKNICMKSNNVTSASRLISSMRAC